MIPKPFARVRILFRDETAEGMDADDYHHKMKLLGTVMKPLRQS